MAEVRTWSEGTLRWVEASGRTGAAWATAASPKSGLIGFVQPGATLPPVSREYATIENRGTPNHHKLVREVPPEISFSVLAGVTADYPIVATATGASVRMFHLEYKQAVPTVESTQTGIYYRWHNCVVISDTLTENPEGNVHAFTVRALQASGPSNTGYLS